KYLSNTDDMMMPPLNHAEIENYVRKSGARVIERKGATFYAVSVSVAHICKCLLSSMDTTMTVSTMMHGEYGIDDVCLSVLNAIDRNGVRGKILIPLTDGEIARLRSRISEYYQISQNNVHAYVLGEHGDSSFVPWSLANISNVPID
ncbi:MAG: hypothetical protein IIX02_03940, partial [Clostridia bacterium]|nr:hypothetical protein [Clostridia bacterium]